MRVFGLDGRSLEEHFRVFANYLAQASEQAWLAPITVVWRPKERHGQRQGGLRDLLLLSNPREPGRARQVLLDRFQPDRRVLAVAEPAQLSTLRTRWTALGGEARGPDETGIPSFTRFVAHQAALALGRAETRIIGSRYKRPKLVREEMSARGSWRRGTAALAQQAGRAADDVRTEAGGYLDEMVAWASPFSLDLRAALCRFLYTQAYEPEVRFDPAALQQVKELADRHPLALLFSHKTYLDAAVAVALAHEHGISTGYILGGINMDFALLGSFLRRSGVAFIRRGTEDNPVYRFALREYVAFLAEKRFNLMWAPEGTRSRTGKLARIKYGTLIYMVRAYLEGHTEDFVISPWAIAYDELAEVAEFARYAGGDTKKPESLRWAVRYVRGQRNQYGRVYVNFGQPISLREALGPPDPAVATDEDRVRDLVQQLAAEIAMRMNDVTAITPVSLVSTVLLGQGRHAFTTEELAAAVTELAAEMRRRGLLCTEELSRSAYGWLEPTLRSMARHGALSTYEHGRETLYFVDGAQALQLAYYRNSISHFFLAGAVARVALTRSSSAAGMQPLEAFWSAVDELHALFQPAFFLADAPRFRAAVEAELRLADPAWQQALTDPESSAKLSQQLRPHGDVLVLRSFVECYLLVAEALADADATKPIRDDRLVATAMRLGVQYLLQNRMSRPEAISQVIMQDAVDIARQRGLLEAGSTDLGTRRRAFATELSHYLGLIDEADSDTRELQ